MYFTRCLWIIKIKVDSIENLNCESQHHNTKINLVLPAIVIGVNVNLVVIRTYPVNFESQCQQTSESDSVVTYKVASIEP
jgi:hypothetical protein